MNEAIDILLVDDEPRNLDALEVILENPGYRLLRALDADSALRLLIDHDVAAIILDIKMPGTTGFELAQMIKATKRYRQIPILFLTAYHLADQDMLTGYGAGAADYLTKPLRPEIVRHKVAVFADLFRKTRALSELNEKLEERVRERTAELIRSEASLREADRKKDEFIAVLAHELRNPLAPVLNALHLLRKRTIEDGFIRQQRDMIERQIQQMKRLLDDLLDVARITRGRISIREDVVDVRSCIDQAVESVRHSLESKRHGLSVNGADEPLMVRGDAARLTQIFTNLLTNAVKFTKEGGAITVSAAIEGDRLKVRVRDNGIGMTDAMRLRAFDLFAQAEQSLDRTEGGLGLGLTLVRRLVEMHGGTVEAHSDGPGRGSEFTITLPRSADAPEVRVAPVHKLADGQEKEADKQRMRIVVVDDNADAAETLAILLQLAKHEVHIAYDGPSGVALVTEVKPDAVFLDIGLPRLDGYQVARELRKIPELARTALIALSGYGQEEDRRRAREAGFDHHMIKPVNADEFFRVLSEVTKKRD